MTLAQYERPGSTSAQFLKIDVSPRGAGMAGAYISAVEGAEGAFYNPAVIARLKGIDVAINHNEWFAGINHEFISLASNFGDFGSFAFSAIGFYTDEMKVRTPLQPDGTGETFYAGAYQFGLTYSRNLTDKVSFGGSLKYLDMTLYKGFSESAFTTDISANYSGGFRDLNFALGIFNFGESMKFVNEEYPMPTLFVFGMSINSLEADQYNLKVTGSVKKPNEGAPLGQVGLEYDFIKTFFIRAGYNIGHEVAKYAFGFGLARNLINEFNFRFDYAYNNFSQLGAAHRFGIGMSF
jgi:hypothetical protein